MAEAVADHGIALEHQGDAQQRGAQADQYAGDEGPLHEGIGKHLQDDHDSASRKRPSLGGGEIVGHGTEKYAAASNVQNRPGTAQSGLEIMGYHDHGHAFLFIEVRKGLIEILGRCRIQAGNGLIQNQQLSGGRTGRRPAAPICC